MSTYSKEYYLKNKDKLSQRGKIWQANNRESINARYRRYTAERKRIVLEHYGDKCTCCGETEPKFLTIDHINNDGHKHRHKLGSRIYWDIIKNNFPSDLQILCFNCNCAKGIYGICPHEEAI